MCASHSILRLQQRRLICRIAIPVNEYYEYFGPDYKLDVRSSNMEDLNTPSYLNRIKSIVMENLRGLGGPPSAQMMGSFLAPECPNWSLTLFADIPRLPIDEALEDPNRDEDMLNPDERRPMRLLDSLIQRDDELSDSEDEGEGGRRNQARHRDPESVTTSPGRRLAGVGIMGAAPPGAGSAVAAAASSSSTGTAASAASASALAGASGSGTGVGSGGPSAHSVVPVEALAASARRKDDESRSQSEAMDVDMDIEVTPGPPVAPPSVHAPLPPVNGESYNTEGSDAMNGITEPPMARLEPADPAHNTSTDALAPPIVGSAHTNPS